MATATPAPSDATPAAVEFALLQSWLTSGSSSQLAPHGDWSASSRSKVARCKDCFFRHTCNSAATEMWGQLPGLRRQDGEVTCSHDWAPARLLPSLNCSSLSAWAIPSLACPASFPWIGR